MKKFLLKFGYPIILILIAVFICFQNYTPGTYLSGWDTLHPEFNFADYFKRTLSMWQQHQGLGAVASQAHAAELPRLLLYYSASLILPESFLRYSYFFACLILGLLGMYFLISEFFRKKIIAFLSALLYLLNLVTVQHFFVPLEMFATQYAALPWIFLFSTAYLLNNKKRDLILFSLIIIFSASLAHTPTLYYSFLMVFIFYLILLYKFFSISLKRIFGLFSLIIILNLYWILPNLYYISSYGHSVINSKIHFQFSERAFQTGTNYGNLVDSALLKNFLFDWGEYDNTRGRFVFLLEVWKNHLNNPLNLLIGFLIFVCVLAGIVVTIKQKSKPGLLFLPVFVIPLIFIANDNFIFQGLYNLLDNYYPTLKESLRFPFTKFSTLLVFSFGIYFAFFLNFIIPKTQKYFKNLNQTFWTILVVGALMFYMLPFFSGNLISKSMRVETPMEYFQMFQWFKMQNPNTRIATFPINTYWGWVYYNFGYEGAGFLWFGLDQPVLDREFDRWHPRNEDYYHQMSHALYSKNQQQFEDVLEKYQINWLVIDKNIIEVSSTKALFTDQLEELISKSDKITRVKEFNNLVVYQVNLEISPNNFISFYPELKTVSPIYDKTNFDQGFRDNGFYLAQDEGQIFYPFRSLLSNRNPKDAEFEVEEQDDKFVLRKRIPEKISELKLNIPEEKNIIWFDEDLEQTGFFQPTTVYDGQELTVTIPKLKNYFSSEIDPAKKISLSNLKNCDYLSAQNPSSLVKIEDQVVEVNDKSVLRLNSVLSNNCTAEFILPNISHEFGYLISVETRNIQNKSILFWLENLTSKKADIETYLPKTKDFEKLYFIQPPMEEFGQGYFLHFDNVSFNKKPSVNDLGEVSIYPVPYDFLTQIYFGEKLDLEYFNLSSCIKNVSHPIGFYYSVDIDEHCKEKGTLILSQSSDPGWIAFNLSNFSLIDDKKLINNWANGWQINTDHTKIIIIFFVPQLLQIIGMIILVVILIIGVLYVLPKLFWKFYYMDDKWLRNILSK